MSHSPHGHQHPPEHEVPILVDGHPRKVRRGPWIVKDLKAAVGVDPAKVLAEITPQGLKDLADTATIEIHEGLRFMSHARSGGAS
ncbi:hypothetical protein FRZ61_37420 [Hypericibacter adhaerens]|jgi:hypothetical protein|uniref:Uncharacterized protein n=1 Tax=Hypericibacter adhaerens TaxID=2602016 RepID=A0A5J6N4T9_9PROT|nr:hypothetical protein [Hypericibacter adhaerens]QEX23803.1 hypothetical protein FRZ61_37420 [Hypericibacter adhaerens]